MPRITVIMATYNYAEVLPFSIGSILAQDFEDFEVLVIGDGCTDNSGEVVERIRDPRVKWFNLPFNTGQQAWPNSYGLRHARGEIIAYLSHDDLWLPHHLRVLVEAIDNGADMAYGIVEMIPPDGAPRYAHYPNPQDHRSIPPTGVIHRKTVTDQIGGMRDFRTIKVAPDADLWNRIKDAGYRVEFIPRLTSIKVPASQRENIYRDKFIHEQEQLIQNIQDPDFERIELAKMLIGENGNISRQFTRGQLKKLIKTVINRIGLRLRFTQKSPILQRRVFKGLTEKTAAMDNLQDPDLPFDFELGEG